MSKSNYLENSLLRLIFNGTSMNPLAQNAAAPATDLYVSLHTAAPSETDTQNAHEANYTGYARIAVPRTSSDWIVTSGSVSPDATIIFPLGSGGSGVITHFAIGLLATGAGAILYIGTVTPNQATGNGIRPKLTTATTITEE